MDKFSLYIIGTGGHAKVVQEICEANNIGVQGFIVQKSAKDPSTLSDAILEDSDFVKKNSFAVAIGDQVTRHRLINTIYDQGGRLPVLVHPSAILSKTCSVGFGTVICAMAYVGPRTVIGSGCILNTRAQVDHDCTLGSGIHLAPGVVFAGTVACGNGTFVGTGSKVIPNICIGENCCIGAGSLVLHDVPDSVLAFGSPCQVIREFP